MQAVVKYLRPFKGPESCQCTLKVRDQWDMEWKGINEGLKWRHEQTFTLTFTPKVILDMLIFLFLPNVVWEEPRWHMQTPDRKAPGGQRNLNLGVR